MVTSVASESLFSETFRFQISIELDGELRYTLENEDRYKMDNSETKLFCGIVTVTGISS